MQKLDANDGIKDVALVPEISEDAAAATGRPGASSSDAVGAGSGDAGGVAEALRGGGGDDEYAEEEEGLEFGREELAWMSSIVRDVPENVR